MHMQTRRERVHQAAIDEIKAIAWETANTDGVDHITVNGIAREMGMTPPAFYSYFKSREELLRSLVIDAYHSFQDALIKARDALPESDGARRIYHVYIAYREWSIQNPSMFGLFAGRRVHGFRHGEPEIISEAEKGYKIFIKLFETAWQQGIISVVPLDTPLPESYRAGIELNRRRWNLELPIEVYHKAINIALISHGMISMELSGRFYNQAADMDAFYQYQVLDFMKKLGICYSPDS